MCYCRIFLFIYLFLQENPFKMMRETAEYNLEPLGSFENYNKDWRSMAELILQVIIIKFLNI